METITKKELEDAIFQMLRKNETNFDVDGPDRLDVNPYSCGVHDGLLDVATHFGIDIEEAFNEDYYN